MSESKKYCKLQSISSPVSIDLPDGEEIVLGRSRITKIGDPKCSRKQIACRADFSTNTVHIKVLGTRESGLNRKILKQGDVTEATNGDVLEFIHDNYMFVITFKESEVTPSKRSASPASEMSASPVPKKVHHSEGCSDSASRGNECGANKWESVSDGKLLIFTSKGVASSSKIASFDMDGTLICTKSGKVFPAYDDDWKIQWPQVISKLKSLHQDGFKVVIFTNQAGIEQGKVPIPNFKQKMEKVISAMGVPAQAFVSPGRGVFRKPCPGMWWTLTEEKNDNIAVNMSESFYCGDAAGRVEDWASKKKKDFSCSDRLFALNLNIPFLTPEELFFGEKAAKYELPQFKPDVGTPPNLLQPSTKIPSDSCEVVVLVGPPGSGKSHFCRTHLLPAGYTHINRDTLGSWQKCVSMASAALSKNQSVVIDNTNPDLESRKRFIEVAEKASVPCRCFVMSVSEARARHNNKFRELMKEDHTLVSDIIVRMYKSKYVEPRECEGFSEIVHVNFVPKFQTAKSEKLYGMYLLDKY